MPPQSPPTDDEIRRAAESLFASPDFLFLREEVPGASLIARLAGHWQSLMNWLAELRSSSPLGWLALMLLLLAVLALLIWHMVWTIRRAGSWSGEPAADAAGVSSADPLQILREEVREAERRGDWTAALRARFLLLLQREGRQRPGAVRRGWTNRECARLFRHDPRRAAALLEVVSTLDQAWYGNAACQEPEFQRARGLLKDVLGAD